MCPWPVLQAPDTVAVQVFLQDRRLLERKHAERYLTLPRVAACGFLATDSPRDQTECGFTHMPSAGPSPWHTRRSSSTRALFTAWATASREIVETRPVAARRRIGNRFLPPPLFLHEPGRFEGTQVDSSRLDGCQQTLDVDRVRPQTTRRQSVTETRSHGFDSRRLHRYRALQSVPHPTRWQEITQSARADLDWPTTRPHEWDTRTSASQIRCSTSAATRTRISPSSHSPRSLQRWVRHQVLSQASASMSLSPLGSRAALVSELVDIHVRNRG